MKVSLNENNTLISAQYDVALREQDLTQFADIMPKITVEAKKDSVIVASLKVDNMELLPTAKINIAEGTNTYRLQSVSIRRRRREKVSFHEMPAVYKMELCLTVDGKNYIKDEQQLDLNKC